MCNFGYFKTIFICFRLDIDQSAFSPTEIDDSFLYIRYPRATSEPLEQASKITTVDQKLPTTAPIVNFKPDFSKHTPPCQKFISYQSSKLTFLIHPWGVFHYRYAIAVHQSQTFVAVLTEYLRQYANSRDLQVFCYVLFETINWSWGSRKWTALWLVYRPKISFRRCGK